jgi:Acylamino-acid-releasing enzyme, N-terminal domain
MISSIRKALACWFILTSSTSNAFVSRTSSSVTGSAVKSKALISHLSIMSKAASSTSADVAADYAAVLAQAAGISEGWLFKGDQKGSARVLIKRSVRDLESNKARAFVQEHFFDGAAWQQSSAFPMELNGVVVFSPSPSGKKLAVVREAAADSGTSSSSSKGTTSYVIEIWADGDVSSGTLRTFHAILSLYACMIARY